MPTGGTRKAWPIYSSKNLLNRRTRGILQPCCRSLGVADREGFEPSVSSAELIEGQVSVDEGGGRSSPISSLKAGNDGPELDEIGAAWPKLSPEIRRAVLAIVRASGGEG